MEDKLFSRSPRGRIGASSLSPGRHGGPRPGSGHLESHRPGARRRRVPRRPRSTALPLYEDAFGSRDWTPCHHHVADTACRGGGQGVRACFSHAPTVKGCGHSQAPREAKSVCAGERRLQAHARRARILDTPGSAPAEGGAPMGHPLSKAVILVHASRRHPQVSRITLCRWPSCLRKSHRGAITYVAHVHAAGVEGHPRCDRTGVHRGM